MIGKAIDSFITKDERFLKHEEESRRREMELEERRRKEDQEHEIFSNDWAVLETTY